MKVLPVILSGGSGTRLWPLSRDSLPKQFLPLFSEISLFQETIRRVKSIEGFEILDPLIICNYEHRFLVKDQLKQINSPFSAIITEPLSKDTAPAVTISALYSEELTEEEVVLLILPSDHLINEENNFLACLQQGLKEATKDGVITLGIKPYSAHTGYGYLRKGKLSYEDQQINLYEIDEFVEKPAKNLAEQMFNSEEYLWNSGIFLFKSKVIIDLVASLAPQILTACKESFTNSKVNLDFVDLDEKSFSQSPSESIDYAVIEKVKENNFSLSVIEMEAGWTDIGTWSSIWSSFDKDKHGNVLRGNIFSKETEDCLVLADNGVVATYGLKDLVVVVSEGSVIVIDKSETEKVKEIVNLLKSKNVEEASTHKLVFRPWGSFFNLVEVGNYKVKRLTINPHQKISLQKHNRRSEHWVVVKGSAVITKGEESFELKENQSTYIPLGTKHSIENKNESELEIIEVQTGDYLEEDDIQRFEDIYGREDI